MKDILVIIIGIISILGSVITVVSVFNFIKFKVDNLDVREKEFKAILEKNTAELSTLVNRLGVVVAEQAIINKFTTGLLEQLTHRQEILAEKLERVDKVLADYGSILSLIKEIVTKKGLL